MRFHVFNFACYYPGGGMWDYVGSFKTLEEARGAQITAGYDNSNIAETQEDGSLKEVPDES